MSITKFNIDSPEYQEAKTKKKIGLTFYRTDTDRYHDIKIKKLKREFNCCGIAVYDYILCQIYRINGCFIMWDEGTAFDVADYFGLKETLVKEIVNYCCAVGLFNKELLTSGNLLTSQSIQLRYREMCISAKRSFINIPAKFYLLPEEDRILLEEVPEITEEIDKGKESSNINKNNDRNIYIPTPVVNLEKRQEVSTFVNGIVSQWNTWATKNNMPTYNYNIAMNTNLVSRVWKRCQDTDFSLEKIFSEAEQSDFLMRRTANSSPLTFDWIFFKDDDGMNFRKILEGNYRNGRGNNFSKFTQGKQGEQVSRAGFQHTTEDISRLKTMAESTASILREGG